METRTAKNSRSRVNIARRVIQAVFLGLFIYLFIQESVSPAAIPPSDFFLRFDPLSGIFSLTASRNIDLFLSFWPAWIILALTLFGRRFFCGWICPLGTCFDAVGAAKPKQLKYYKPAGKDIKSQLILETQPQKTRWSWLKRVRVKYIFLLIVIGLSFAGINILFLSSPLVITNRTLYTLLIAQIPITFIVLILIAFIYRPRFWCEEICPLGALFSLFSIAGNRLSARFRTISIVKNPENCTWCGACWRECNFGVNEPLTKEDGGIIKSVDCTACGRCIKACPADNALELKSLGLTLARSKGGARPRAFNDVVKPDMDISPAQSSKLAVSRGEFMASLGVGAVMLAGYGTGLRNYTEPVLRMPGAQNEGEFLAKCARCAECMMVCPADCIKPMGIDDGFQKLWTPRFRPREAWCIFEQCDQACAKACPYGAIKSEKPDEVKIGTAHINKNTCRAYNNSTCLICKEMCRFNAIDVDDKRRPSVNAANCTGCGACQTSCITKPESIAVYPIGMEPSWSSSGSGGSGGGKGRNR